MAKVVVIGGGWSGCAAAISAAKAGADAVLLERTDMLLGTGLVGGIMRNNGRFTATEEAIAMGGGELFQAMDQVARHRNIEFPGHKHANLYDVAKAEPAARKVVRDHGVDIRMLSRATDVTLDGSQITSIKYDNVHTGTKGGKIEADVFVEATGTFGPQSNCSKYGHGCVMCIMRCPTFGPRGSIAARCGVKEMIGGTAKGTLGSMSGSCKIFKESLSLEIQEKLNKGGVAIIPIPEKMQKSDALALKACQQYNLPEFAANLILLDTGHAKLMTSYFPLEWLHEIPGFENARYEDPYAGGMGNSMRYLAISPRDNHLKVDKVDNLFCCGEKAGPLVGHTEAIVTGTLAGRNAVLSAAGQELLEIPPGLAIGDAIAHVGEQVKTEAGLRKKYTFSGATFFKRMQEQGLYTTDVQAIRDRVREAGMENVFNQPVHGTRAEVAAAQQARRVQPPHPDVSQP